MSDNVTYLTWPLNEVFDLYMRISGCVYLEGAGDVHLQGIGTDLRFRGKPFCLLVASEASNLLVLSPFRLLLAFSLFSLYFFSVLLFLLILLL